MPPALPDIPQFNMDVLTLFTSILVQRLKSGLPLSSDCPNNKEHKMKTKDNLTMRIAILIEFLLAHHTNLVEQRNHPVYLVLMVQKVK